MPQPIDEHSSVRNRLLAAFAPGSFARILPDIEAIELRLGEVLVEPDVPTAHAWFVEKGLVTTLAATSDGQRIEVGHIGVEGLVGSHVVHLVDRTPHQMVVQIAGAALRMPMPRLKAATEEDPELLAVLLRYAHFFEVQIAHTALANGRYSVRQRLARWLVMTHDRISGDDLDLTHLFLSEMLGVRRSGVTNEIHVLEGEGMIKATRSRIRVLDRMALEGVAGGSYGVPEHEYERLIGKSIRKTAI